MFEQVWQPRQDVPSEPVEALIRAARRVLPLAQGAQAQNGASRRTMSLDLAEWGNPAEVSFACALEGKARFAGRDVLSYILAGEILTVGAHRTFSGAAKVDVATGAVLDIDITPSAPVTAGPARAGSGR